MVSAAGLEPATHALKALEPRGAQRGKNGQNWYGINKIRTIDSPALGSLDSTLEHDNSPMVEPVTPQVAPQSSIIQAPRASAQTLTRS